MRVVSLTCSNTEIVCALGCAHLLVGVDNHSDYPEDIVQTLPRVGPDLQIDPTRVADLEPDLVLASLTVPGHEHVVDDIAATGLTWVAPDPECLEDVYRDIRDIGARLEVPDRAERLVDDMEAAMPTVSVTHRPRILVEWWPKPVIVPGKRSWVTDLLERAGATNPMGHRDVRSSPVTDEEVADMAPDAVVISWCGVPHEKYRHDVVTRREAWQPLPAIRDGQVHSVREAWLGRPGPRLVEGYRAFRTIADAISA